MTISELAVEATGQHQAVSFILELALEATGQHQAVSLTSYVILGFLDIHQTLNNDDLTFFCHFNEM